MPKERNTEPNWISWKRNAKNWKRHGSPSKTRSLLFSSPTLPLLRPHFLFLPLSSSSAAFLSTPSPTFCIFVKSFNGFESFREQIFSSFSAQISYFQFFFVLFLSFNKKKSFCLRKISFTLSLLIIKMIILSAGRHEKPVQRRSESVTGKFRGATGESRNRTNVE